MGIEEWTCTKFGRPLGLCFGLLIATMAAGTVRADGSRFDLIGPNLQMKVTRNGKSLPMASVPALQAGDRVWIHASFPSDQSARYLLIVAFLQGPTNPPPESWFTKQQTWSKQGREEGTVVTVPAGAQQALLFLAPDTGGGFTTVRSAVRGKPGVFVRAAQDLEQASLGRTRLDKFLEEITKDRSSDAAPLAQRVALLSRTLAVKADADCFNRPAEEQPSCLTQDTEHLTLEDAHSESMVATLTSGSSADLVGALGSSPVASKAYFGPYVGSAMDIVRLMNGLHTAEYQYLPALTVPRKGGLNLRLSAPPSFHNPKSVLVVGLPNVENAGMPELRPVDAKQTFCAENTSLVLPVTGEPLVFSTRIAHDFAVRVKGKGGTAIELPASPDAARGGFTVDTRSLRPEEVEGSVTGTLHGFWGFDAYEGPSFPLRNSAGEHWSVPAADANELLAGSEDTLRLQSGPAVCVEKVSAQDEAGKELKATWRAVKADELELKLSLKEQAAGPLKLMVKEYGIASPEMVALHAYTPAAKLERFTINAGDRQGTLTGTRLNEVSGFELSGVHFVPAKITQAEKEEELEMDAPSGTAAPALQADEKVVGHAALKDGRVLDLPTTVEPPRPKVTLVSKKVKVAASRSGLHLGNADELPQGGQLSFLLKTEVPERFPHSEEIEVETTDGSWDATLSVAKGNLFLQDAQSVLAVLDPLKNLGGSAFGTVQFRAVDKEGDKGDWQPLAKLVRVPTLSEIRCPDAPDQPCVLSGANLFLLDSVASDAQFKDAVTVPAGYADATLIVPRPSGTLLYVKLRDDPGTADMVTLPVLPEE